MGLTPEREVVARSHVPLRILHLGKYYPPAVGGIETHVRTLAHGQSALGAEVTVACVDHRDRAARGSSTARIAVEADGPVMVVRVRRLFQLAKWDYCPGLAGELRRLIANADIVHLHVPNATMVVALARVVHDKPLVVGYHSDIVRQKVLVYALRPFERRVFARACRFLPTSPRYAAGSAVLKRYSDRVEPLPLGIDLDPYLAPNDQALEFAQRLKDRWGDPLWLSVGRLVYYKGFGTAVDALRLTRGTLLVVGTGPDKAQLRRQAERQGVADRVVWLPRLSDDELVGAYHAATALWFPSNARSEAFGLTQVEAMACGCPVINTSIPHSGVPWVSEHEISGLTVPVDALEEFATAANRLLGEPGLRNRLSIQAGKRAVTEFSAEQMARRSLAIYREVLGRQSLYRHPSHEPDDTTSLQLQNSVKCP